ncbi:S1C family serine protease [Piscinibacter sakaiensis]|uniref:S1C family serine protease n=1 Tax=Piscinibacter sakaiensis TaxID=1547922 RepID=UPI003AAFCD1E
MSSDRRHLPTRLAAWLQRLSVAIGLLAIASAVCASKPASAEDDTILEASPQVRALARAHSAMVGLRSVAVDGAGSIRSLGQHRIGSGVLIDDAGSLILTIGYLVLEAEDVTVELDDGRSFPARVVAYDLASGFGLVESLAPLPRPSAPFGRAAGMNPHQPLMIATGGSDGSLSIVRLVSSRPFTAYWEYHIDAALFTAPPRADHPGAGLFNSDGELLGIGSLLVGDAAGPGLPPVTGNMFVPIDLLLPILAELRRTGSSAASARAWLGINCIEADGIVRLTRITRDGPADAAGLRPGDAIIAVDGTPVQALETFYKRLWTGASPNREIRLDIRRDGQLQQINVQATDRRHMLRHAGGI